jgi:hypothetical protein
LPQILKKSGYKYFRFWRPHAALSAKIYLMSLYGKELMKVKLSVPVVHIQVFVIEKFLQIGIDF